MDSRSIQILLVAYQRLKKMEFRNTTKTGIENIEEVPLLMTDVSIFLLC